jgi:transcriptional regulator with XRE-family HTH domain
MSLLSKKLKKLRMQRGFTMREVADGIAVPLITYREWEYGRAIRGEFLIKLAKFFGISAEDLSGQAPASDATVDLKFNQILIDLSALREEVTKKLKL